MNMVDVKRAQISLNLGRLLMLNVQQFVFLDFATKLETLK